MSKLGSEVDKFDCCVNECLLYFKEDNTLNQCRVCGAVRYVFRRSGMRKYKDVAVKRMLYFPIIPRLRQLYASKESATQMRWHHENTSNPNDLRHPTDGKTWKHFDKVYPDYASDPRNVRLSLCTDEFTSYIQVSSSPYSCWQISHTLQSPS